MSFSSNRDFQTGSSADIDLAQIARVLARKRWWVIGPTLAALTGALVFVNAVKPRYSAEARVLLENQENYMTRTDKGERLDPVAPDAEAVQSQIQLLTSRDLARKVIKSLELQGNPEFDPLADGIGPVARALVLFGLTRDPMRISPEDRILESYFDKLVVLSPTKTRVLSIEFSSRDPDLAAQAANRIAEFYLEMQQEAKRDNARVAAASLGTLVADLQARAAEADARAEEFRIKTGLLVGTNNTTLSAQHLGDLTRELSISRTAQAEADAKAKLLREMLRLNRVGEIPDVARNELIRRISEQRGAVRAQLAFESRTLLPAHPRIKELSAQLADLDAQWRSAAESAARTLENEARIAGSRVDNLMRVLDEQKKVAGAAGADEVHLRELERAARLLKEELEADTAKYQEALAHEGVKATPAEARIFQRALAPQIPAFPKKLPITAFATIAAFVLSVGAVVSGELLSGRPRVRSEIPHPAPLPVASVAADGLPLESVGEQQDQGKAAPGKSDAEKTGADAPEAARERRERGEKNDSEAPMASVSLAPSAVTVNAAGKIDAARMAVASVKVMVVNSSGAAAGFAATVELARALARRGRAIVAAADVADADYDRLAGGEGSDGRPTGLADLIAGVAAFAEAIHRDPGSRLHVMPAGRREGVAQYDAPLVLDALAQTYDFVVFATSSLNRAKELARLFDLVLVHGDEAAAESARDALLRAGAADAFILDSDNGSAVGLCAA